MVFTEVRLEEGETEPRERVMGKQKEEKTQSRERVIRGWKGRGTMDQVHNMASNHF